MKIIEFPSVQRNENNQLTNRSNEAPSLLLQYREGAQGEFLVWANPPARPEESISYRRDRDSCTGRNLSRNLEGRICRDCWTQRLRQIDVVVDSRTARFTERGNLPTERKRHA
jgi:hypothetical protein